MGQASSRYQQSPNDESPANPPPSAIASSSTAGQPESQHDATPEPTNPPRSRRSSLRKSIINLVKPSSARNRTTSQSSTTDNCRRSWRNSRRWSKAPPESTCPVIVEPPTASSSDSSIPGPSNIHAIPLDKGKQRDMRAGADDDEQDNDNKVLSVSHNTLLSGAPGLQDVDSDKASSNAESSHTALDALCTEVHADHDSIVPQSALLEVEPVPPHHDITPPPVVVESPPTPEDVTPPPSQEQVSSPSGPRPFPPPGTLVVVQGIVHTTDVANTRPGDVNGPTPSPGDSQTNQSSPVSTRSEGSSESATGRVRNRLSTLLRPRSVAHGSNSSASTSRLATPEPSTPAVSTPVASTAPSRAHSTAPTIDESHRAAPEPPADTNTQQPAGETRSSSISSSSIDVLGTLLSVAAAATAASLLTGSSEPILSSGLAPTGTNASPQIPNSPPPTSPPIPNLPPYSGVSPAESGMPDISAAGRAERMREAWGAIRQRLGLRPSSGTPATPDPSNAPASPESPNSDATPTVSGLGSLTDTRELMLAEMARAFNVGLGLNGLGGLTPASNATTEATAAPPTRPPGPVQTSSTVSLLSSHEEPSASPAPAPAAPPANTIPPEGSFERFLLDLQVDLRLALTTQAAPPQPASQPQSDSTSNSGPPAFIHAFDIPERAPTIAESGTLPDPPLHSDNLQPANANDTDDSDSMPGLQDVSDSDSDSDSELDDDEEDEEYQSADHGSLQGAPSLPRIRFSGSGSSHMDASGRINWWRLYRFPPIPPPRADLSGVRPSAPGAPVPQTPSTNAESPRAEGGAAPTDPLQPEPAAGAPPAQPTPTATPSPAVVPVIVVGLQSVDTDWRHEDADNEDADLFGVPHADSQAFSSAAPPNAGADGADGQRAADAGSSASEPGNAPRDGSRPARTRGWHTRAANALRNLRPGRRNADASSGAPASVFMPGSRTFLIYVIGGYYPPDHSIVTGGPNVLDSFEALLELADLLGQVKPPTATKDALDKSGLEIVKASEVPQHEKDGKISSNCTDRCLICLDDYEAEDDVRILSCRHAFHKGCVDEWLLTGRNNCPACRSTGVNTDSHVPSQQAAEAL